MLQCSNPKCKVGFPHPVRSLVDLNTGTTYEFCSITCEESHRQQEKAKYQKQNPARKVRKNPQATSVPLKAQPVAFVGGAEEVDLDDLPEGEV